MLTLGLSAVEARESAIVATPFEVGESRAGNYLAALVSGADRDTLAASTYFQETLRFDPRNPELIERAFLSTLANGNISAAVDLAKREIAINPNSGLAALTLAVDAIHAKKFDQAIKYLKKPNSSGRDVTATLLTAWALAGKGQTKQAIAQADRLNERNLQIFRNYHAGMIADVGGDNTEASARLKAAFDSDNRTLRLVDAYARFVSRTERDAAQHIYEDFDKLLPRHPLVMSALADLTAGKPLTSPVKNVQDGAAEVLYGLGATGGQQGDEIASIIYLRLSLFLKPDNSLAQMTMGDLYGRLKQDELAIDSYEQIADSDALRGSANIQIAIALESLGKTEKAVSRLNDIIAADPKNLDALTSLGNLYAARKDYPAAESAYSKAVALLDKPDSSNWLVFYRRGTVNERMKHWPAAEADLKKALELFPEQPQVLNYLGYSWIDLGNNLDEGFKMLRRAVELRPSDGYIVDSLGWAEYKLGHIDEAVSNLERAVALTPGDSTINDHLGDAYWRAGRKLEAKFQWNHARDFKPEPEDLPKILKKIESGLDDAAKPVEPAKADPPKADTPKTDIPKTATPQQGG